VKSCAFSGHRPKSFPWKYDETDPDCVLLKKAIEDQIHQLIDSGVTDFYSGLAQGVDTWSAQIVLAVRKQNPGLRLHCVLPCRDQAESWGPVAQELHQHLQAQAETVICLSEKYHDGCMLARNRYLVDHAAVLLAVYNGSWRGGTAMTVRYARKQGKEIIIINPKTRKVEHFGE